MEGVLSVYVFVLLERIFCYNQCGFAPLQSLVGGLRRIFFCSNATLVQKICSDVSGEVFGKIALPEENCYDSSIVQKICSNVSGEVSGGAVFFCIEPFFATMKQKRGFLLPQKQFAGFRCESFLLHSYKNCYNKPFSASLVHYRSKSGIEGG
jgi:hypothetical protein